jgi:hypothetical protein
MKCINCGKEIIFGDNVIENMRQFGDRTVAISKCCGAAYTLTPVFRYNVTPYDGEAVEDYWGNPITKVKKLNHQS